MTAPIYSSDCYILNKAKDCLQYSFCGWCSWNNGSDEGCGYYQSCDEIVKMANGNHHHYCEISEHADSCGLIITIEIIGYVLAGLVILLVVCSLLNAIRNCCLARYRRLHSNACRDYWQTCWRDFATRINCCRKSGHYDPINNSPEIA